jgi:uncharacterized protein DUF1552
MSYRMARRSFLRGCGGSVALLGPLLRGIEARAQGIAAPLRFLIIRHACGSPLDLWRPTDAATTTTFTLPANSAPFAPLQSKMVLVDGLNIITASPSGYNSGQNTSEGGTVAIMTGVPTLGLVGQQDHCAGGPSIDQILLDQSPILGGAGAPLMSRTPFGSLQLAADIRSDRDEIAPRVLSYRPPTASVEISLARQPMYPKTQPLDVFTQLFGGPLPTGASMPALLAQKLSVLDYMRSDLQRLNTLVPASEKPRLLAHADAIQSLENVLRKSYAPSGGACAVPATPPSIPQMTGMMGLGSIYTDLPGFDYYTAGDPTSHPHEVVGRLHLSLIKAAFLCDLVRVATFSWSSGTSWVAFPGTFNGATLPLPAGVLSSPHYEPLSALGTTAWWTAIDQYYSTQTSLALQDFAAATDVDGNSLLDNTVIPYISELGRRWDHNQQNVPFLVFGGKNTRIKGGTFLKVTDGTLPQQIGTASSGPGGNRPVNDAWLALAPIFGVTMNSLGASTQYTGPLAGLVG